MRAIVLLRKFSSPFRLAPQSLCVAQTLGIEAAKHNKFARVFDLPPTSNQFKTIQKRVKRNSLDLDAVFTKFKVNKFSLNFFLKNLQFDSDYKNVRSRTIKKPDG